MTGATVGKAYKLSFNWAFAMPDSSTVTAATCQIELYNNNQWHKYFTITYDPTAPFGYKEETATIDSMDRTDPSYSIYVDCSILQSSTTDYGLAAYVAFDDFSLTEADAVSCPSY